MDSLDAQTVRDQWLAQPQFAHLQQWRDLLQRIGMTEWGLASVLVNLVAHYCWVVPLFDATYDSPLDSKDIVLSENEQCVHVNADLTSIFGQHPMATISTWAVEIYQIPSNLVTTLSFAVGFGWRPDDPVVLKDRQLTNPMLEFLERGIIVPQTESPQWLNLFCCQVDYNTARDYFPWYCHDQGCVIQQVKSGLCNSLPGDSSHLTGTWDRFYFHWDGQGSVSMQINNLDVGRVCTLTLEQARVCRPFVRLNPRHVARFL